MTVSECNYAQVRSPPSAPIIVERDDQIGLNDDAAGPFESRQFAESVASQSGGASS
jgi:hypothetical protein